MCWVGVISIAVALLAERGEITYDANLTNPAEIVHDITDLGFGAVIIGSNNGSNRIELSVSLYYLWQIIVCLYKVILLIV